MINYFLSKTVPVIGKYFRPVALLCAGIFLIFGAWFIAAALIYELDFHSFGSAVGSIFTSVGLIFFIVVFISLGIASIWNIKARHDVEYESWGVLFYFLVLAAFVYAVHLFLKSKGIDLTVLDVDVWFAILFVIAVIGLLFQKLSGLPVFLFKGVRGLLRRLK